MQVLPLRTMFIIQVKTNRLRLNKHIQLLRLHRQTITALVTIIIVRIINPDKLLIQTRETIKTTLTKIRIRIKIIIHLIKTQIISPTPVSYTHLRAHETVLDIVCRLLLEKKKYKK